MIATFMAQLARRDQFALRFSGLRFNGLSGAIAICRALSLRVVGRLVDSRLNSKQACFESKARFCFQSKIVQRWQRRWHETSLHFTVRARFAPLHVLFLSDTLRCLSAPARRQLFSCDPVTLDVVNLRDRNAIASRPQSLRATR